MRQEIEANRRLRRPPIDRVASRRFTVIAAACSLAGCWVEEAKFTAGVVWSDDGEEVAFTVLWHDVRRRQRNDAESEQAWENLEYQHFRVPRDLSEEPVAFGRRRSGSSRLYYMRTEGYLLIQDSLDEEIQVVAVDLDGNERVIADSATWPVFGEGIDHDRPSLAGVPSPDGRFVAIYSYAYLEVDTANPPTDSTFYKVVAVADPDVELAAVELDGNAAEVWRPDGSFVAYNGGEALEWREGESSFVPTTRPTCSWPDTTSSRVSADGTIVDTGIDFETPFVINNDAPAIDGMPDVPFGCGG